MPTAGRFLAASAARAARRPAVPWPKLAIAGLGAVVVVELVGMVSLVVRPLPAVDVPILVEPAAAEPVVAAPAPALPSLAASATRPLFTASASAAAFAAPGAQSSLAKQLASRLTLMGIVAGEPPQAIIEDSQTQRTYFVTVGQTVVEGAVLEQVLESRVVLDLGGEKIELAL